METVQVVIRETDEGVRVHRLDQDGEPAMTPPFDSHLAAVAWVDARNERYAEAGKAVRLDLVED